MSLRFKMALIATVIFANTCVYAINTRNIDRIRKKDVLESQDSQVIGTFIDNWLEELQFTEDFSSIATLKSTFEARTASSNQASADQYDKVFFELLASKAKNALSDQKNGVLEEDSKAILVTLNILITVSDLQDKRLANLAMEYSDSSNVAIRYAAIKAVANKKVVSALNNSISANINLIDSLVEKFSAILETEQAPQIVSLIAVFAGGIDNSATKDLMLVLADKRITQYTDWSVVNEAVDAEILNIMADKIKRTAVKESKSQLTAKFAQLYSCAIQRYIAGQNILSDKQLSDLKTVIAGTENGAISDLTGSLATAIKKALTKKDKSQSLILAADMMLGSSAGKGMLAEAIDFDYGVDGENRIYAPAKINEPNDLN